MNERASLVEQYAQRGWACFPLKPGGKQPATRSGVYAGTDDLVTLRRWWKNTDYNIGINCGASNLVVVDLDIDKEGVGQESGVSWWLETCSRVGEDPWGTYSVVTASGGLHLYYELPESALIRSRNGVLAPLVDIKSNGGYVVAAGSEVDGHVYEWTELTNVVAPAPIWLMAIVMDHEPTPEEQRAKLEARVRFTSDLENDPVAVIRKRAERLASTPTGNRNETLNAIAFSLFEASSENLIDVIEDEL